MLPSKPWRQCSYCITSMGLRQIQVDFISNDDSNHAQKYCSFHNKTSQYSKLEWMVQYMQLCTGLYPPFFLVHGDPDPMTSAFTLELLSQSWWKWLIVLTACHLSVCHIALYDGDAISWQLDRLSKAFKFLWNYSRRHFVNGSQISLMGNSQ